MSEIDIARALLVEESALLVTCTHQSWMRARRLTRAWTKVRDREMEATTGYLDDYASAVNQSPTSFVDNPKASHEVFPGLWAHQSSALTKGAIADNSEISGVVQVLQEVFPVTAIADLVALVRRREVGDARENIFDFQDGQGEQVTLVFPFLKPDTPTETACMQTLTEADLLTLAPSGGGYLFDTRKWAVDQDTHTASLTLVFRKVTWNEWGHDAYVEDFYEYDNVGDTNTEEIITRTWVHIRNADVKAAVTDLRTGARTAAGLSLLSINVSNGGGGACTISVREQKIDTGTDQLKGREILRPFGWPECVGIRDIIVISLSRYPTLAAIEAAIDTLELLTPPTGFTFVRYDTSKDGSGKYEAEFRYEKVTWSNHTGEGKPVFKQTSENNTEGNGKAQGRQACALTQDTVVAAFNAITAVDEVGTVEGVPTTLVKYVLSSKGISIGADGEFSLSAGQTSVYEGTTASDALIVSATRANPSAGSTQSLQRVWFRRTLAAKNTLTGAGGQARLNLTLEGLIYRTTGWSVTDHHDGAYTVVQQFSTGSRSRGGRDSHDRTDEYLLQRDLVLKRASGGADFYVWVARSVYARIFTSDDTYTSTPVAPADPVVFAGGAESAWAWALAHEKGNFVPFEDTTGVEYPNPMPSVRYIGGDAWQATAEVFNEHP